MGCQASGKENSWATKLHLKYITIHSKYRITPFTPKSPVDIAFMAL